MVNGRSASEAKGVCDQDPRIAFDALRGDIERFCGIDLVWVGRCGWHDEGFGDEACTCLFVDFQPVIWQLMKLLKGPWREADEADLASRYTDDARQEFVPEMGSNQVFGWLERLKESAL